MKKIAILLNGPIKNDSRVIKEIKTMSQDNCVHLFYINGSEDDRLIFNENVSLYSYDINPNSLKTKIIRCSCFYNEFNFFTKEVLKTNIKFDIVWANDLPDLKPAILLKKKIGCKVVYDSHEIFVETLNQQFPDEVSFFKMLVFKSILRFMQFLGWHFEKKYAPKADVFVTVCDSLKDFFEKKYSLSNIKIVMNCPRKTTVIHSNLLRDELNIPDNYKIFIFQGVLNKGRALDVLIDSFKYVTKNVKLVILGSGMLKPSLMLQVKNENLQDLIFFKDAVLSEDLLKYTASADVGINLLSSINLSKYLACPNKLFEYVHAGIPVIASDTPENRKAITNYGVGMLVENDAKKIAEAIDNMAELDISQFKENCKKASQFYNWENQEKSILEILTT